MRMGTFWLLILGIIIKIRGVIPIAIHSLKNSNIQICWNMPIISSCISRCIRQGHARPYLSISAMINRRCILACLKWFPHIIYCWCSIVFIIWWWWYILSGVEVKLRICIEVICRPTCHIFAIWIFHFCLLLECLLPAAIWALNVVLLWVLYLYLEVGVTFLIFLLFLGFKSLPGAMANAISQVVVLKVFVIWEGFIVNGVAGLDGGQRIQLREVSGLGVVSRGVSWLSYWRYMIGLKKFFLLDYFRRVLIIKLFFALLSLYFSFRWAL